jgi:hypothetical protein
MSRFSGFGGLGLGQAPASAMPSTGTEYVLASSAGQAVLRPLRYPLYDSLIYTTGLQQCQILFGNHRQFSNGNAKTECDTNMTLDSTLGSPSLFDLVGFTHELYYGVDHADFTNIYTNCSFHWVFGTNTYFTRTTLRKIPQGIGPNGFDSAGLVLTQGLPVVNSFYNFTTPDRKARRIDSVEQFRAEICPCVALSVTAAGVEGTVYMIGILYSNL